VHRTASLRRSEFVGRRLEVGLAAGVATVFLLGVALAVGTGDYVHAALLGGLALLPFLVLLALKRPYAFPYGLYVLLVPFDNLLLIPGAGTLTKLLGMVSITCIVVAVLRNKKISSPPLAVSFALAYLAWDVFSLLWAPDLPAGLLDATTMCSLVIMYALLAVAPVAERDLRLICALLVLGGVAASLYGMVLLHGSAAAAGDYGRLMIDVDNRRIDPNHFANSLLAPLALAVVGLLHARKPAALLMWVVFVAILAAGIAITLSREALLAVALIATVLILFSKRRVVGFAIAIPLMASVPIFIPSFGARMVEAASTGGAGRGFIWHVVWRAVEQHPLFGWGVGGALEAYDRNYLAVYQFGSTQGWTRPPHNTPLHMLVDLGIVGLVLVVAAYLTTFRQCTGIERGDRLYDLRAALTGGLIALGFISLFIDVANYKYLWIVLATIAQLRTVARTSERKTA
jgi:O-antigen ligase